MIARSALAFLLMAGTVTLGSACTQSGPTPATEISSSVETISWTDGKAAYSIRCDAPGGCQQRTLMMCSQGPYTVLKSENMPTAGDARSVRGPASVVIRCG